MLMPTILVVDDSSVDRSFVGGLLAQEAGWTIAYAADGLAALETLSHAAPDVIVTDLLMPEFFTACNFSPRCGRGIRSFR